MSISDLSFTDYLALEAWGSGSLKAMRRGPPARVQWERSNPLESTDAIRRGSAAHCLLLTPELYSATYAHKPEGMNFATKEGKAWRDDHASFEILTHEVSWQVSDIVEAIQLKEPVRKSLAFATHKESSIQWIQENENCKGRPDWIDASHIYDLKISRHAEGKSLAFRAYTDGWMHQLAHNRTGARESGLPVIGGRLVVVSPKAPHYVHLLEVKPDALDLLELENNGTLRAMGECRKRGVWPGTLDAWELIEPPPSSLVEFGEATLSDGE